MPLFGETMQSKQTANHVFTVTIETVLFGKVLTWKGIDTSTFVITDQTIAKEHYITHCVPIKVPSLNSP